MKSAAIVIAVLLSIGACNSSNLDAVDGPIGDIRLVELASNTNEFLSASSFDEDGTPEIIVEDLFSQVGDWNDFEAVNALGEEYDLSIIVNDDASLQDLQNEMMRPGRQLREAELSNGDVIEEPGDITELKCGQKCSSIDTVKSVILKAKGTYKFYGNCNGTGQGKEVILQAMKKCWPGQWNNWVKVCPAGCPQCVHTGSKVVPLQKNCPIGGSYSSNDGSCTLVVNGNVRVKMNLRLKQGVCVKP